MLASWRGARFEVIQVLRDVIDHVLKEPGVPDGVLLHRARVRKRILSITSLFLI